MEKVALTAVLSATYLLAIAYLVFWKYREYRVDLFRQKMFELRADLFDEARKGNIGFDHPAYQNLRTVMNGFIRFGHRLDFWSVLFLSIQRKKPTDISFSDEFKSSIQTLPKSTRQSMERYREKMNMLAAEHVFWSTPEIILLLIPAAMIAAIAFIAHAVKLISLPAWKEKVDNAAFQTGKNNNHLHLA